MKCSASVCAKDASWRAQIISNRVLLNGNEGFCNEHAKLLWDSHVLDSREGVGTVHSVSGAACFELELVMAEYVGYTARILLREVGGTRLIFFPISFAQCYELYWAIQGSSYNSLSLHIALKRLVEHVGGILSYVLLDRFNSDGYFEAHALIRHQNEAIKLRLRPSDGLVLAILTELPFLVAESVFSKIDEWSKMGEW